MIGRSRLIRRLALAALLVAGACMRPCRPSREMRSMQDSLPPRMLWAWERSEHLQFIDPHQFGVAYLAATLHLTGDKVQVRPRLEPIAVPPGCAIMTVVHIKSDARQQPLLSAPQRAAALRAILHLIKNRQATALQIDFDARLSERTFYRELLVDLRSLLPSTMRLSMTALASWCLGDDWLESLPVDEAVPMLFRMGTDSRTIRSVLTARGDFRSPLCRHSWGIATDEPAPTPMPGRRIYIFNSRTWSPTELARIMGGTKTWR
jgi:hypothetical protein